MAPETTYARSGDLHIAYQVVRDGPMDLVYVPAWITQVEHYWEEPGIGRYGNNWGEGSRILALAPRSAENPRLRQWFARLERLAASPGTAARLMMMNAEVDVRAVLPSIKVPTLVLHRVGDAFIDIRHSRY